MKNLLYHLIRIVGPIIPHSVYTNLLFLLNCIRLKKPFYFQNISNPKTFNEKINYIKYFERNPLAPIVADKVAVREYVVKKIGPNYLVPLITVFDTPEQIDFSILPNQFVMKLNNGSGFNLICTDKSNLNTKKIIQQFKTAYERDLYVASREWHYKAISPKILVEELLDYNIRDYKIFCTKEKGTFMIQVDVNRFTNHKRDFYSLGWQKLPHKIRYGNAEQLSDCPKKLEEMIQVANLLSQDFTFSRIDLYENKGKIYFGEITLHPGGGVEPFDSYLSDLEIGNLLSLAK